MTRYITFAFLAIASFTTGCATLDCYDEQDQCGSHSCRHGHHRGGDACGGRGNGRGGVAPYDRPFPLGAVTDTFWETQQTNAEAADFIFHDHEFVGETAQLGPACKRHLEQ